LIIVTGAVENVTLIVCGARTELKRYELFIGVGDPSTVMLSIIYPVFGVIV
jgi:hypothetical protein